MALEWIKSKLGITELEQRVGSLEVRVEDGLKHFGCYSSRTKEELVLMLAQIDDLIAISTLHSSQFEILAEQQRAKNLVKRLKNNKTRIHNQLEKNG